MKSIKPGRGPSMMSGMGSIFAAVFGVIWTLAAISMGAPFFFALFGVCFVAFGVVQAVYHFKNARSRNRYSTFDITDGDEEPDPLNQQFGSSDPEPSAPPYGGEQPAGFCPYCGQPAQPGFAYCPKCGKKLPD